ncbi:putative Late nodulin [Medicago truncatula]|uniref:Putative Late nodulin n=1 Tax=Medicago truncatula TaxID=3880 RepID=A0A396HVR1_MEDTR|nr:putative Late nodulin [Medicago truncatula]
MYKIIKFVYAMIILNSLFLFAMNVAEYITCETDADCPKSPLTGFGWKCIKRRCVYFDIEPYKYQT